MNQMSQKVQDKFNELTSAELMKMAGELAIAANNGALVGVKPEEIHTKLVQMTKDIYFSLATFDFSSIEKS